MPDYIRKKECLELGLDKTMRSLSLDMYKFRDYPDIIKTLQNIWYENLEKYQELWFEAKRINSAHYSRSRRLWKRIYSMMSKGQCIFLTFTFTDKTLNETTFENRRRYVREFLKSQSDYYVANLDFGSDNEREHYHAVILADSVDYSKWHRYGAIKGLKCKCSVNDAKRLSKYVSKLTNHAIKETTRQSRLIYGRKMHLFD